MDELASLYSRLTTLESELAEERERARRFEWARDQLMDRCMELRARVRQLEAERCAPTT
jgi:chromosome segregation ATPase